MAEGPESCGELEAPLLLVRVSGVLDVPAPLPLDLWPEFFLASVVHIVYIVRHHDKQTLEAAMELDTNSAEQVVDLGLGEG